ncbi:hypothetical protein CVT26_009946 [Gymnopilus dilepis]|uniref:Uncharacterized protein n=1 Tax=Gymnopilus dilepis TaxID=231916 RepID=A0A409VL73_9AGAR|nr:hypothetical protein CVT26_009946 [Gymnopilus dilepis]
MEKAESLLQQKQPHRLCKLSHGEPCSVCVKKRQFEPMIEEARKKLDEAQQAYDRVIQEDRQLSLDMNRLHNPTILRMPVEVSSAIFQLCIPPVTINSSAKDLRKHRRVILALGGVCSGWRDITLSTQQLWTTISLCLTSRFARSNLSRWKDFLTRSGQLALSIYLYEMPEEHATEGLISEVADALKLHWHRLKNLRINVSIQHLYLFQDISNASEPHPLEALQLRCCDEENDFDEFLLDLNFEPASLALQRVPLDWLSIKWSSLVDVDITRIFIDDCSRLLKQTPLLERCRFSEILGALTDTPPSIPVVLPRLEDLELTVPTSTNEGEGNDYARRVAALFGHFTFPALRTLRLNLKEPLPCSSLISLFRRSSCNLRILRIINTVIDTTTLIHFLQEIPSLEELFIDPSNSDYSLDVFLSALAQPSMAVYQSNPQSTGPPRILPNLRSLGHLAQYRGSIPWHVIPPIFGIGFITALQRGPEWRPLHSFKLFLLSQPSERWDIDFNVVSSLLAVREVGFNLQILNLATGQDVLMPSAQSSLR